VLGRSQRLGVNQEPGRRKGPKLPPNSAKGCIISIVFYTPSS